VNSGLTNSAKAIFSAASRRVTLASDSACCPYALDALNIQILNPFLNAVSHYIGNTRLYQTHMTIDLSLLGVHLSGFMQNRIAQKVIGNSTAFIRGKLSEYPIELSAGHMFDAGQDLSGRCHF